MIALLNGNVELDNRLRNASWIGTSVVCVIEFLSFTNLQSEDKDLMYSLLKRINVFPVEHNLSWLEQVAELRQQTKLKLPDAVIAVSASANNAILLSNDKHFSSLPNLTVQTF